MLPPTADLGADFVSELRAAAEATRDLGDECAAAAAEAAKIAKGGGGGMCGGGKAAATVAPAPDAGLVDKLLAKDVAIAELRARLRKHATAVPAPSGRRARRRPRDPVRAAAMHLGRRPSRRWRPRSRAATTSTAVEAVPLLPKLRTLLCDATGRVKAAKLGETFGTDASSLVEVVLAAANAKEPTRVFNIECRQGRRRAYPLMADVDAGFVMAREGATLAS